MIDVGFRPSWGFFMGYIHVQLYIFTTSKYQQYHAGLCKDSRYGDTPSLSFSGKHDDQLNHNILGTVPHCQSALHPLRTRSWVDRLGNDR